MPGKYQIENPMVLEEYLQELEYRLCERHPEFMEIVAKYRKTKDVNDLARLLTDSEKKEAGIKKMNEQVSNTQSASNLFSHPANKIPCPPDPDNYDIQGNPTKGPFLKVW